MHKYWLHLIPKFTHVDTQICDKYVIYIFIYFKKSHASVRCFVQNLQSRLGHACKALYLIVWSASWTDLTVFFSGNMLICKSKLHYYQSPS